MKIPQMWESICSVRLDRQRDRHEEANNCFWKFCGRV